MSVIKISEQEILDCLTKCKNALKQQDAILKELDQNREKILTIWGSSAAKEFYMSIMLLQTNMALLQDSLEQNNIKIKKIVNAIKSLESNNAAESYAILEQVK